jgi:hypothetical protein
LEGLFPLGTPLEQFQRFQEEMLLYDMIMAEKRLEKIELGYKRGVKTPAVQIEEKALHKIVDCLQNNQPLTAITLNSEEEKAVRGFQFFLCPNHVDFAELQRG